MNTVDTTRLAGDAYNTRLARIVTAMADDKTRLAQQGYQSKLARDAVGVRPDASEFYKVGEKIGGRYEVSAIHHGAMGVVYGCFDHETKLPRALKTVRAQYASDKQVLSMFESEAAVWISLEKHPYIVRAYLVERFKNLPYVITEYVRGPEGMEGDLRGWLGHPRLTLPVAVAMALQIAQGMQHAVRKLPNLVHRDLKPANILVNGDGKAMVTDFGLVNAAESGAGTPAYMSPEQWRGDALDARSDIYAYGCILFEMFSAHRLFPALTEREWERAHLESSPAALTGLVPGIPSEMDQFVQRCLEKTVEARPLSWDEAVTFFAEWYHRLTGKSVVFDFSSLALDAIEWIDAANSLSILKCYEEAINACDRALRIDPNFAGALNNKGNALHYLKCHEEAVRAYDRAIVIDPTFAEAWYNKASALRDLKRHEDAIQALDRALVINPKDSAAWYNKGVVFGNLKRHEEAVQAYDQALAINPNNSAAWYNKGRDLHDLKRHEEAIQAYDRVLEINPNDASAWTNKASVLHDLARYSEAIQAQDRAMALDQVDEAAWFNRGMTLGKLGRHEEAILAFDRALAINQNYVKAWYNKGVSLRNLNRYEEEMQAYDRALAIDENISAVWNSKGDALQKLKRHDEAIQAYDRALAIQPNYVFAMNNKGIALRNLKRYEEAIQIHDHAIKINSSSATAWIGKGIAFRELKRYEDAIQAFEKVLTIHPNFQGALQLRNDVIVAMNDHHPWFSFKRFLNK